MISLPHRIRRQRWSVCAGSTAAAFSLRQRLRDDWPDVLMSAFEKVFDEEAAGEELVRIPRIELTLKLTPAEQGGTSWSRLLHDQLFERLREILQARRGVREKSPARKGASVRQDRQDQFQILLSYLRSGSVSWEAAGIPTKELTAELQRTCRERWPEIVTLLQRGRVTVRGILLSLAATTCGF